MWWKEGEIQRRNTDAMQSIMFPGGGGTSGTGTITGGGTISGGGTMTGGGTITGGGIVTGGTGSQTGGCVDAIPNCAEIGDQMCMGETVPWATANCAAFCGLCGEMPTLITSSFAFDES